MHFLLISNDYFNSLYCIYSLINWLCFLTQPSAIFNDIFLRLKLSISNSFILQAICLFCKQFIYFVSNLNILWAIYVFHKLYLFSKQFIYFTNNLFILQTIYLFYKQFIYFTNNFFFIIIFSYTNHPLQGFRSHCSVRGYSSLLVATAEAEVTTRTGLQHTHAHTHTHTQPPTQPFITSKHDMKSLLVREQVAWDIIFTPRLCMGYHIYPTTMYGISYLSHDCMGYHYYPTNMHGVSYLPHDYAWDGVAE